MSKQTKKQQKDLRSAAARKGWETRRAAKQWWVTNVETLPPSTPLRSVAPVGQYEMTAAPDPNPWRGIVVWIKAQWARVFA